MDTDVHVAIRRHLELPDDYSKRDKQTYQCFISLPDDTHIEGRFTEEELGVYKGLIASVWSREVQEFGFIGRLELDPQDGPYIDVQVDHFRTTCDMVDDETRALFGIRRVGSGWRTYLRDRHVDRIYFDRQDHRGQSRYLETG